MRPAKLRFAFPLPQPPPEQTQPPPQGGLAFPSKLQGNSFTPSPVVNTSLLQSPLEQTATTPKPSSFRNFHFAQAEGKYPESPPQGGHDSPLERMRSAASQDTAQRRG